MGYWERLFDPRFMWDTEWKQRRDIIDAENLAMDAAAQGNQALAGVTVLHKHVSMLQAQVHDLSITVMALVEMLADAKQIEPQELRARVEAASVGERAEAAAAAKAAADAAAAERARADQARHAGSQGVTTLVDCIRCHKRVPANQTTMTGDGVVCDNCAR